MTDNLPPRPPFAPEFQPRWPNDPGGYTAEQMQAYARAAIEKDRERQIVPAGLQNIDRSVIEQALEWVEAQPEPRMLGAAKIITALREALAQPQPVQEPVAYLDIGAGGYLDIATNLTDEQLLALPKGRHALVIAGTFGIDGYTSPQAQPQPVQEPVAEIVSDVNGCLSTQWSEEWTPNPGDKLYTSQQAPQPQPVVQSVQASQCHNVMCQPYCDATGELVLPLCKCKPANQQKD